MKARTDADWEAINDAQALARAEIIRADKKRLKNAISWAKKLVKEERAEYEAMRKIIPDGS